MDVQAFFDISTSTLTYVVYDARTRDAIIIDPVLDFDLATATITTDSIARLVQFVRDKDLLVHYILETHAHADHISGAHTLHTRHIPKAHIAISDRIQQVQATFQGIFNLPRTFRTDGSQFHRLLRDGEEVRAGSLAFTVIATPGHTPACASYRFGDALFTGDALFMPDSGTGRCDFPGGAAQTLYHSVHERLYRLADDVRVFVGHDYQPGGRPLAYETTIGESKRANIHLRWDSAEKEFIAFRTSRDASLAAPRLLLPSIQVNIAAGALPVAEANGTSYLRLPVTISAPETPNVTIGRAS